MKLELIRDEAGFQSLEPWWDRLLEQSATPSPFLRWDWVRLWWEENRNRFRLAIGVMRDSSGEPEGIAPLVVGRGSEGARRHLRELGFMNGLGPIQGERMDFIVRSGREAIVTPRLIEVFRDLETEWDVMRLNKVPEESANYPVLRHAMAACGRESGVLNRTECVCIHMPRTWQEYENTQSGHWRRKMRRRWEVMTEEEGARAIMAGKDVAGVRAFDEFAHLHALKWPEGVSSFLRPASLQLHRRLAERWISKGLMLLPCLELHGKLIAGIYGLACGKDLLQYQLGWDPAYARLGLGNLAMRWSIDSAMRAGFERYDLLPGQHDYKHSWSQQARYVADLECFHHQKPRALLFHLLRSLKRRVSAPVKAHA